MTALEKKSDEDVIAYGVLNFCGLINRMIDEGLAIVKADPEIPDDIKEALDISAMNMKIEVTSTGKDYELQSRV